MAFLGTIEHPRRIPADHSFRPASKTAVELNSPCPPVWIIELARFRSSEEDALLVAHVEKCEHCARIYSGSLDSVRHAPESLPWTARACEAAHDLADLTVATAAAVATVSIFFPVYLIATAGKSLARHLKV